jgi:CheY-like chemotaxis protein
MTAKTILLVEDSTADAYLIQRAVKDCGPDIQLWTTADGGEALQLLRKATPALILIDLRLPKMSGTQLLAEIRQLPAYQRPRLSSSVAWTKSEKPRCACAWGPRRMWKNPRTFTPSLTPSRPW